MIVIINNSQIDIDKIIKEQEKSFLKRKENGLLLSDADVSILKKYDIDYQSVKDMKELLFIIDDILNENNDLIDLEELCSKLEEISYYNMTNK